MNLKDRVVHGLVAVVVLGGCSPGSGHGEDYGEASLAEDLAQYDALVAELEGHRTRTLEPLADGIDAVGERLFWIEYPTAVPVLHSRLASAGSEMTYTFSVGQPDPNYRVSATLIVTAENEGEEVRYRAYAADAPASLLDEMTMPAPAGQERWWAYAVSDQLIYLAVDDVDETALYRWQPGSPPAPLLTFQQIGIDIGLLWDFMVEDTKLLLIESGRLWYVDLATQEARWLSSDQQITGSVHLDAASSRVLYHAADGAFLTHLEGGTPTPLGPAVASSGYELNPTFSTIHHFSASAWLHQDAVIYLGQAGVFGYDLSSGSVWPILLEPRGGAIRVVYRDPQVLEDGTLLITGLESETGAVGADGPVWSVAGADWGMR